MSFDCLKANNIQIYRFCRYQSLGEPCQIRHDNLEDALLLYQFYRDVEDELSWIREKYPIASSEDLGTTLTQVQNLQKKHAVSACLY